MPPPVVVPWRGPGPGRPAVPLPPERMPLLRGGRPLKRWRYVGCFGPEVMLCAAVARVGVLRVSWWAVWDRETRTLLERTRRGRPAVELGEDTVRVRDGDVSIDLRLEGGRPVETVSPHGAQYAWTRKHGAVRARGAVAIRGVRRSVEARGLVDESAGYHARHTRWTWSAGVGVDDSGAHVGWNLVCGLHDDARTSERTVWVDGEAHEVGPVRFADDLGAVRFEDGGELTFAAEARRSHRESLLVVASSYEQPFGTFAGALPFAGALREGYGVMERHAATW